jgi:hypothetical protein
MPAAARTTKQTRPATLRMSDAARWHASRLSKQLQHDEVKWAQARKMFRATYFREAVVGNKGVRKKAAEQIGVDRKLLIDTYNTDSKQLFPEDVEAEVARLRARNDN